MSHSPPRMLVFDLDGTLVDSAPDIAWAVNRMLSRRGHTALAVEAVTRMVGDGVQPLIARAFAATGGVPDEAAARDYLADYESRVAVESRLYAGMEDALATLESEGWRFAVCTNKPERAARLLLETLGIGARFAAVGGGDSFAAHKPDPRHLAGTLAAAGGEAGRALMVGDHANDMQAALGCGVKAVFAGWGYGRPGMEQGAAAVAATPAAMVDAARALLP